MAKQHCEQLAQPSTDARAVLASSASMWKTDHVDAGDGLSELRAASSVKDLHRLLVTRQVSGRSTQHQEAVELFVHHHGEDSTGAVDTALLLCTEPRWQRCTAKLIAGICDGVLPDSRAPDGPPARPMCPGPPCIPTPSPAPGPPAGCPARWPAIPGPCTPEAPGAGLACAGGQQDLDVLGRLVHQQPKPLRPIRQRHRSQPFQAGRIRGQQLEGGLEV